MPEAVARVAVYTPTSSGATAGLSRLVRHRDLLLLLVQKDLKAKYKGMVLGFLWSLLNPLLMMIVYSLVFAVLMRVQIQRYPVFVLSGALPWNAFTIGISTASMTIVGNGNLVRRVAFPREFLPLASVLSALANLVLSLGLLPVFALVFRQPLGAPLLAVPAFLLLQLALMAGLGLVLSALTVYLRDLENLIAFALMVLFFATPVIYPLEALKGSAAYSALQFNPLAWLMDGYHRILYENTWPDGAHTLALTCVSAAALGLGWFLFRRLEARLAEEV